MTACPASAPFRPSQGVLGGGQAGLRPTDLDAFCTYLGRDFRLLPEHRDLPGKTEGEWAGWANRACRRQDCPAKTTCPFHILDGGRQAENLSMAFGAVVKATCLGESQFVGRSSNVFHYKDVLAKNGVPPDGELWRVLFLLGTRGFVIGYEFSNSDGVHGWLMPDETDRLASLLRGLALPTLEPTFEAMEGTRRRPGGYAVPGWEFEELSLCFVKFVATVAAVRRKGILWGNDVSGWLAEGFISSSPISESSGEAKD